MAAILQLNSTLHLGMIDGDSFNAFQQNRNPYFKKYHSRFWTSFNSNTMRRIQFRGEGIDEWIEPRSIPGNDIKSLQAFLHDHGFMPGARIDGVFDYWTLSSVRLFQEYVRTVEEIKEIGIPDGRVGSGTHDHMRRWQENKLYCEWGPEQAAGPANPYHWPHTSKEYDLWMNLLGQVKAGYQEELKNTTDPADRLDLYQLREVEKFPRKTDTLKINDWSFNRKDIHLVGLRCFQEMGNRERGNDDLFVLLMNGMVFKFWGSTDPKPAHTSSDGFEPYLVEGQHKYRLSWHKRSTGSVHKVYKALVPYDKGVLVFRDWSRTDSLNEEDIKKGLLYNEFLAADRENPNTTINIHWTFDGRNNWSAGCQVISGRSYINNRGDIVDCTDFSAPSYATVSAISKPGVKKNRGAYTFISDFVFAYARPEQDYVLYTLGRDGALEEFAEKKLKDLLGTQIYMNQPERNIGGEAIIHDMVNVMINRKKMVLV